MFGDRSYEHGEQTKQARSFGFLKLQTMNQALLKKWVSMDYKPEGEFSYDVTYGLLWHLFELGETCCFGPRGDRHSGKVRG